MNITANGNHYFPVRWQGGMGQFKISGVTDGATVTLKMRDDTSLETHALGTDTTFEDAKGVALFTAARGTELLVNVTGGGGSIALSAGIQRMK